MNSDELSQVVRNDIAHSLSTNTILSAAACKPAFMTLSSKSQAGVNPMRLYIIHHCLFQSYMERLLLTCMSAGSTSANSSCPKISFSFSACSATAFRVSHPQARVPSSNSEAVIMALLLLALQCQHLYPSNAPFVTFNFSNN